MNRLSVFALALAICLGTTAMLANSRNTAKPRAAWKDSTPLAVDGAFRDGLYLGRLSAEQKLPRRPAIGRWSTARDRAAFVLGFRRGYDGFAARSTAPDESQEQARNE